MSVTSITFHARGMHCHGCEHVIESSLRKLAGVASASASYPTETVVVAYDPQATDFSFIRANVEQNGYRVVDVETAARRRPLALRLALVAAALAGLAALILFDVRWIGAKGPPDIAQHMSLELIFLLGLLTGFHCVGMCGAFVIGYSAAAAAAGRSAALAHLAYAAGKTLSYTAIGAAFGALGAIIAFTPFLRGVAGVAAGAFLIVFGLNMLGLFAPLRRFRLGLPAPLQGWIAHEAGGRHQPFVIGLLNGLMIACGPLQAMYVMAAGTGSPIEGAKMLFAFGAGTLPVMLAFGMLTSVLSGAVTHRLLQASGVIVVALGAVMINRGLILTGAGLDLSSLLARLERAPVSAPAPVAATQTIRMEANALGYKPNRFTLLRGVPVDWVIDATEVTECNHRIVAPALNLEFDLKPGLQTIRFTPSTAGVIPWSCWMGMMRGAFDVVDPAQPPAEAPQAAAPPAQQAAAGIAPQLYAIAPRDTPQAIARRLCGDARQWRALMDANPGLDARRLKPGRRITLPAGCKAP